jgi:hypothetical protein
VWPDTDLALLVTMVSSKETISESFEGWGANEVKSIHAGRGPSDFHKEIVYGMTCTIED